MTRHRLRHERAYAAGARAACEEVRSILRGLLRDPSQRAELDRIIDNVRDTRFAMPVANSAHGTRRRSAGRAAHDDAPLLVKEVAE